MEKLKPKFFSVMKSYNGQQFKKDMIAGIIVAIIALPLSIAFALACGVSAEKGIYSAMISSVIIAVFGGSRVQITGPTGAFIIINQTIISKHGMDGLMMATIIAGIMLILMGLFRLGKLIKFIPSPITIGFTGGIAISIFTLEVKDFLGLSITKMPTNFFSKWYTFFSNMKNLNWQAVLLGLISIAVLLIWPKINKVVPNSLVAIVIGTIISVLFKMDVKSLGEIPNSLELPTFSGLSLDDIFDLVQPAFTIAILVAMQALLSSVVTDEIINSKQRSNMELIAEGVANFALGLLGCIPATGGVARSIANAKYGGRTPIAAIFHSITLFLFLFVFMPLIKFVPLSVLAAVIIVFSYNMFNVKAFLSYLKAPKSDVAVLIASCILTFAFDLVLAIEIGMLLACALFMKRMADVTDVWGWKYLKSSDDDIEEESDPYRLSLKEVPKGTLVYEISGPLFFGAADKLLHILDRTDKEIDTIIIRMRSVPAMDITALNTLKSIHKKCNKKSITLIFSHVLEQPLSMMEKAGFVEEIGRENICCNIDAALTRVKTFKTSLTV